MILSLFALVPNGNCVEEDMDVFSKRFLHELPYYYWSVENRLLKEHPCLSICVV